MSSQHVGQLKTNKTYPKFSFSTLETLFLCKKMNVGVKLWPQCPTGTLSADQSTHLHEKGERKKPGGHETENEPSISNSQTSIQDLH